MVACNEHKIELQKVELISNFRKITKITLFHVLIRIKNPCDIKGISKTWREKNNKISSQQEWKIKKKRDINEQFLSILQYKFQVSNILL